MYDLLTVVLYGSLKVLISILSLFSTNLIIPGSGTESPDLLFPIKCPLLLLYSILGKMDGKSVTDGKDYFT